MTQKSKNSATFEKLVMPHIDLLNLGMNEVAYIKQYTVDGQKAYVLHAADGTALAMQNDISAARLSAAHSQLGIVSLH
jgi:hypothetical protein